MEIWDIYDIDRNKTNKTHVRGTPLEVGAYQIVVHVWMSMAMPCLVSIDMEMKRPLNLLLNIICLAIKRGSKQHHI